MADEERSAPADVTTPGRTLAVASFTHALHDGYTDLLYVLLPVWQREFALSYAALATLRGLYSGAMALLQVPAGRLAGRFDARIVLAVGTLVAALGYALAGWSGGLVGLGLALVVSGAGSSVQHPIGSGAVSHAYGSAARGPLGTYNFAGDLGKAALPALTSLLITSLSWRRTLLVLPLGGIVAAVVIVAFMPRIAREPEHRRDVRVEPSWSAGFRILFSIGVLDTAVRMGLLTFLPFLLEAKGASLRTIGLALTLVFAGGAGGKFVCGWIGARLGVVPTVLVTEGGTALFIIAVLLLPLGPALVMLPLLGVMLNGTSSVLYGTVPELATQSKEHAFAIFYTGTIGSGALAPVAYSLLGDASGPRAATVATAITALSICPLALGLDKYLGRGASKEP